MAGEIEIKGTIRLKTKTAAQWTATNPVLAAGEPATESDTRRLKIGDGTSAWAALPYTADPTAAAAAVPVTPAVAWKEVEGMLYVSPNTTLDNPILNDCYVGILRYKSSRCRKRGQASRPMVKSYKVVQDESTRPVDVEWTAIRIKPIKVDVAALTANNGWMPVIRTADIFNRFVETESRAEYANSKKFTIHRGRDKSYNNFGPNYDGLILQKASIRSGVVLFRYSANRSMRYEGPRAFFKVNSSNYAPTIRLSPM